MDSKIYLNVIKTLTPTYIHVLSLWSEGKTTMSNLMLVERVLSLCLRDDILEKNQYYIDTEDNLHTHTKYGPNDNVDFMEFHAWLVTYEQIMRDEGLVGNTGTGEDEADRESVFIDPFLTPFVHKRGAEVSNKPFEGEEEDEVDGADEEEDDEDRIITDSGDGQEEEDGGIVPPSDQSLKEVDEEETPVEEQPPEEEEEIEKLDADISQNTNEFSSFAFNMDWLDPDLEIEEPKDPIRCARCSEPFYLDESVCKKDADGKWCCPMCSSEMSDEEESKEEEEPPKEEFDPNDVIIINPPPYIPESKKDDDEEETVEKAHYNNDDIDPESLFAGILRHRAQQKGEDVKTQSTSLREDESQ